MSKKTSLLLLSLAPSFLFSCGTTSETKHSSPSVTPSPVSTSSSAKARTIREMVEALKVPMSISGTVEETLVGKTSTSTLKNEENLILGASSYHIEVSGESYPDGAFVSSVYRSEKDDTCLHYYITDMNEVTSEPITDDDGKPLPWSAYANPWPNVNPDAFFIEEGVYQADTETVSFAKDLNLLMARYTNVDFEKMAEAHSDLKSLWKTFTLKVEKEKIVGLKAETVDITDALGTEHLSYDLSFACGDGQSHEYPLPTPLPSDEAHDRLRNALQELLTVPFSYRGTSESYGDVGTFEGAVTEKGVYYYDSINSSNLSGQVGYVMKKVDDKDTLVHVVRNKAGEYFYQVDEYDAPYDARTSQDMTSLSDLRPQIVMAAELFHYDETTKIYSLSGRNAGVFGKYFSMNSQADPATIQMADRLLISLDDQ